MEYNHWSQSHYKDNQKSYEQLYIHSFNHLDDTEPLLKTHKLSTNTEEFQMA